MMPDGIFPDGIVLVDKPRGLTSHDVVSRLRRRLRIRRVGHGGTLDPGATGLLVLFVGRATRLAPYLGGGTKVYLATVRFGAATDTDDADGSVTATAPVPDLTADQMRESSRPFVGRLEQIPPAISAVHHRGRRAYALARRGESVALEPRLVSVDAIEVLRWSAPDLTVRITCGTGTYIRSLARDWGASLGTVAHVSELRRERSGPFCLAQATTLDDLESCAEGDTAVAIRSPVPALRETIGQSVSLEP